MIKEDNNEVSLYYRVYRHFLNFLKTNLRFGYYNKNYASIETILMVIILPQFL